MIFKNLTFISILSLISIKASLAVCPKDWIDSDLESDEYYGHMGCLYFGTSLSVAWNEAQDFCSYLNSDSHLVEIFSEDQQHFLMVMALEFEVLGNEKRNWWIGLTDEGSEGTWYWSKSNQVANFTSWGTGQPTNIGCGGNGLPANYGVLAHWVSYNWSDYDLTSALCGSPNYPICQISNNGFDENK